MNPLISVIVPAYNAEKYLTPCLMSLQKQTYQNLEIICVNDGSTDGTLRIFKRFAGVDNRFKVLTGDNRGYGASCNKGLNVARGKYITFVESDDFCRQEFYEELACVAEENDCDFVKSDIFKFWNYELIKYTQIFPELLYNKPLSPEYAFENHNLFETQGSIWSAIYRRDLLKNLYFLETPGAAFQDTSFSIKIMMSFKRAYFIKKAYVYYRQHPEQSIKNTGNAFAICEEFEEVSRFFEMTPHLFAAKFHCYLWNYRRIGMDSKLEFLKQFSEEFAQTVNSAKDCVNPKLFRDGEIQKLIQIIATPEDFHSRYGKELNFG
jgi:glycosyltransferase involved in cell wall biosynthesis